REPKHYCGECAPLGEYSISEGYGIMAASRHYTCAEPLAPEGSQNTTAASAHPSESIAYPKDMV
ncbi:MAG TPA: hypothetical protein K8V78_04905, partial [Lacrimispora saccharolytica]|nr:hypothetical protein [Lacrimispora saccharolytica]